jgi:ribosome-associated heat shock protein Hsp15
MKDKPKVRIDKWLWSVRIYKTRRLAAEACEGGKVKINGKAVKASSKFSVGDEISLYKDGMNRKFRVVDFLEKRVGALLVKNYMEDLTPEEEFINQKVAMKSAFYRPKGQGRPTKKERRQIDDVLNN